jgi:hypothetical protein
LGHKVNIEQIIVVFCNCTWYQMVIENSIGKSEIDLIV